MTPLIYLLVKAELFSLGGGASTAPMVVLEENIEGVSPEKSLPIIVDTLV